MLSKKQSKELREHLERAQNPFFLYDNDADGLCSFLLLRRWLGRGIGVAVRSYPELHAGYAQKAQAAGADAVFVLDKPVLSKAFVAAIAAAHLPLIWIDHHTVPGQEFEYTNLHIYNPARAKRNKSGEPVTQLVYELIGTSKDNWIALMGCIADHYLPSWAEMFAKEYPEYWGAGIKQPFDAYYMTEIGRLAQALNFGLKNATSQVVALQNYLLTCTHPGAVLAEVPSTVFFRKHYQFLRKKYLSLLEKAEQQLKGNLLFFMYAGEISMSADLANELCYKHPGKVIAVAYQRGGIVTISLRGRQVKRILEKILPLFPGASGGGHDDAVGARIRAEDLRRFRELLEEYV